MRSRRGRLLYFWLFLCYYVIIMVFAQPVVRFGWDFLQVLLALSVMWWQVWPHSALAFSQQLITNPGVFERHIIFNRSVAASYPFAEGTILVVKTTGYSSTVDQTDADPFTTASGTRVHEGTAASNFLPLGTKLQWGDRILTVEDRMNSRFNNTYRMDVWFPEREEALELGTRPTTIEIVDLP